MKKFFVFLLFGLLVLWIFRHKVVENNGRLVRYNRITGTAEWISIESPGAQAKELPLAEMTPDEMKKLIFDVSTGDMGGEAQVVGTIYNPTDYRISKAIVRVTQIGRTDETQKETRDYQVFFSAPPLAEGRFDFRTTTNGTRKIALPIELLKVYYEK